ncbi:hypothetical protein BESB_054700 [Besnoitia besnoiti]|uniref:Uncharacterized protein n=1 Tax=Besnoitia besnoiti TaxID=94643 RepID=A0A2A9MD63_BESBE|nr:hypothetical protein BESB_054700 [Besnoitia besnoiti]PFH35819.1 hypothetical protein BESB_054700 [Besnoitia besnoiti]
MAAPRARAASGETCAASPDAGAESAANVHEQLELLRAAAPRLSPQPLLLCWPPSACSRAPQFGLSPAPSALPAAAVGSFEDVLALEKHAAVSQVKRQERVSSSLAHALFEALSARGESGEATDATFDSFLRRLAAKAEAALQGAQRCDICGRHGCGDEDSVGEQEAAASAPGGKRKKANPSTPQRRGSSGAKHAALCVVPLLNPVRRIVSLTPPKRVCEACFRVLHLPQLLSVSVASVVSGAPLTRSVFSDVLEHFASVNGYTDLAVAGARLQQAVSLAFSVSLLKRQVNWRLEKLSSPSLDSFFSSLAACAPVISGTDDGAVSENRLHRGAAEESKAKRTASSEGSTQAKRQRSASSARVSMQTDDGGEKALAQAHISQAGKRKETEKKAGVPAERKSSSSATSTPAARQKDGQQQRKNPKKRKQAT